ncbi:MAG: twin-arginine translocase TatA/TatE family subunit [Actinomycetota bacterium]|nr:twin-arginine translocase TatA/TatE family subunit [Actinomycetota bacterium]
MFGIGAQEMAIIALLFLVIFGPGKLPQMARDAGRLMSEARRAMDEFKDELTSAADDDKDDRSPVKKPSRKRRDTPDKESPGAGRISEDEEEYDL